MAEIHVRDFTKDFQAMQQRHADEVLQAAYAIAGDWEDFAVEREARHTADQAAAESLLAEAQEQIAALEARLTDACDRAEQYAEETDDLEDQLDDMEEQLAAASARWSLFDAAILIGMAVGLAGIFGLLK